MWGNRNRQGGFVLARGSVGSGVVAVGNGVSEHVLPGLGVRVRGDSVYANEIEFLGERPDPAAFVQGDAAGRAAGRRSPVYVEGRRIGALAGAHAELTAGTQRHRVTAGSLTGALVMPLVGLAAGLAKKGSAFGFVVFADGSTFECPVKGPQAIQEAKRDAVRFNALASRGS
jgi:hypothetical protein